MTRPYLIAHSARTAAVCLPLPGARYRLPQPLAYRLTAEQAMSSKAAGHADGAEELLQQEEGKVETAVLLLHGLNPSTRYRLEVDGCEAVFFETAACRGLVDASAFGLTADVALDDPAGAVANAVCLARAIKAVPEGGTLRLPAGIWTASPVALKSDITFHLAEGAVLRAPSSREGWPIMPARDADGRLLGSWEGLPAACYAAGIHAVGARNLTIEGQGIIDGSGSAGDWWSWPKETRDGARRPRGLHLVRCDNICLFGFTIRNAPSWTIHPHGCEGLTAVGLHILAPHDSPNTDGFNPESCRNVLIAGTHFSVGDDCIAIKAGKRGAEGEAEHLAETRGIAVRHCLMERGHGGVVIGSEMSGGVHDVMVEDCDMIGTDRGLRVKTRRGRGGAIGAIFMRRVLLDGVETAISVNAHYHCDADGHADWVQSRVPRTFDAGTPIISDITVDDVEIRDLAHAAGVFLGLPEAPLRNIAISRLRIVSHAEEAEATPPIMADHVRPMRHERILAEHAEVTCDDPTLMSSAPISLFPIREAV
ncbi:glycoside hydrolase family 28 protein [Peteryoungia ipomoeae]|uniref:Glycoside hydrolase family 28 protein n=1 Tax=Peteryoungia ipomoeae TaxID=1210932 RepID=A0A4S8NUH7_9HYPH|nr:glycoside hydrolase family 28 protein [Peteryoungia ipomoeae]THV21008.1 glycoside hydrolase family 28 protein [Peteryoungia ipomoeae]